MITFDSRYFNGHLFWAKDARKNENGIAVLRNWDVIKQRFFFYEWTATDRLDLVATKYFGNSDLWWKIMDYNPEIVDPLNISPGTQLRIPNA